MSFTTMKILVMLLMLLLICNNSSFAFSISKRKLRGIHRIVNRHETHIVKTIESENGEVIDCVPLNKQPSFNHPALKNHKIQTNPSTGTFAAKSTAPDNEVRQVWHKHGSCPKGTIPVRRISAKLDGRVEGFGKKREEQPVFPKDMGNKNTVPANTTRALTVTAGYAYIGAKADMDVANPHVQFDDEYSLAEVAVINGDEKGYEIAQSGWGVNPSLYGDRDTHFYVYWSVGSNTNRTGCFDLTCPGFVQTSSKIALGGVIDVNEIPVPGGFSNVLTVWLIKDVFTKDWWVYTGPNQNAVGYFPGILFPGLSFQANSVQWGGEIHSYRIKSVQPHTETQMGNGWKDGAKMRNIEVKQGQNWVKPNPTGSVIDETNCYNCEYLTLFDEPILRYGGNGKYCTPN